MILFLIESDLIFDDSLFRKIIDNPYPDITLVDKYESWMDGTMVTLDEENNIENFVPKKHLNIQMYIIITKLSISTNSAKSSQNTNMFPF